MTAPRQILSAVAAMLVATTLLTLTVAPEAAGAATGATVVQIAPYQFA